MTYAEYVTQIERLYLAMHGGSTASHAPAPLSASLPFLPRRVLIVSPHPDDECLMAGAALRLQQESRSSVLVLPFSHGSNPARRKERSRELRDALEHLGFSLFDPRAAGSGGECHEELGEGDIESTLGQTHPDLVICPHEGDAHPTHVRCALHAKRALRRHVSRSGAPVILLESEYWQALRDPNLRVPLATDTVIRMGEALLRHGGEVARNPYHLSLPAWLMDQERRGVELVHGLGGASRDAAVFSQLYRMTKISPPASS